MWICCQMPKILVKLFILPSQTLSLALFASTAYLARAIWLWIWIWTVSISRRKHIFPAAKLEHAIHFLFIYFAAYLKVFFQSRKWMRLSVCKIKKQRWNLVKMNKIYIHFGCLICVLLFKEKLSFGFYCFFQKFFFSLWFECFITMLLGLHLSLCIKFIITFYLIPCLL